MAVKNKQVLSFSNPADFWGAVWRDALPTGNGNIGAAVFGGAGDEVIMVNQSTLAWQGNTGVLPDVSDKIETVRKQIDTGDYSKANRTLTDALISKGYRPQPDLPLPLCDVKVHQEFDKPVKEYSRSLTMDSGEIAVSYKDGVTRYDRKLFVSRANDLIVYEISKMGPKSIDLTLSVDMHDRTNVRTPSAVSKLPENALSKYEKYFMYFAARNDTAQDFGLVARVSTFGGTINSDLRGITIKGAEKVFVIMRTFVESARDKEFRALRTELSANKLTYEKMLKEHATMHAKLFDTVELDLESKSDTQNESIETLVNRCRRDGTLDPSLVSRLWAYGRYLLLCGASTAGQIMRPVGLWCGDYKAVDGNVDAAGSMQLMYAQAQAGSLQDYLLPVFDRYESVLDELKKNATRLYNCRGILAPSVMSAGSGLLGSVTPEVIHATWVAGSIGALMYDYYLYTQDTKFLKNRALPFMREVAVFYSEFFKQRYDGRVDSYPSFSFGSFPLGVTPDNQPVSVAKNCMIDFAVARELLTGLIDGAKETGQYKTEVAAWQLLLDRIPDTQINADGTVSEYLDNAINENYDTGSFNMLYGVYPGNSAALHDGDVLKASLATAKKRIISGVRHHTASGLMRLAGIFARLGDGNGGLEAIELAVRAFIGSNAILGETGFSGMGIGEQNFWATYNLTANCGLTSAVQEMLVQSSPTTLKVLPARPSEWEKGEIEGVSTRFGATVDVEWDRKVTTVRIKSKRAKKVTVVMPEGVTRVKGVKNYNPETRTLEADLVAGKILTLQF